MPTAGHIVYYIQKGFEKDSDNNYITVDTKILENSRMSLIFHPRVLSISTDCNSLFLYDEYLLNGCYIKKIYSNIRKRFAIMIKGVSKKIVDKTARILELPLEKRV